MASDRAFIFHMCIPWGKTISFVPRARSSIKVKVENQDYNLNKKMAFAGVFVFHKHILKHDPSSICSKYFGTIIIVLGN